jgi:hypothetical protein
MEVVNLRVEIPYWEHSEEARCMLSRRLIGLHVFLPVPPHQFG